LFGAAVSEKYVVHEDMEAKKQGLWEDAPSGAANIFDIRTVVKEGVSCSFKTTVAARAEDHATRLNAGGVA
jgi:hypothetical protein